MESGDTLLALASDGIHANGYSLVRRILDERAVPLEARAPFAADQRMADVLMRPTRIYVRSVLAAISTGHVKGVAHITGGGLIENIPRILPDGLAARLQVGSWPVDPVFSWLARDTVETGEMLRTFNCGIGMVLVVAGEHSEHVERTLESHGETVSVVGALESADGKPRVLLEVPDNWLA
ncbi:MAG: AIR synthase-related protein [bacterium]|nr:AIR synthase-related protein [bacterium]